MFLVGITVQCGAQQGKRNKIQGHLVFDGDLIGPEVAGILVVLVQQGHSGAGAVIQELHAQHLQLVHTDVEGLLEPHGIHGNDLHTPTGTHV